MTTRSRRTAKRALLSQIAIPEAIAQRRAEKLMAPFLPTFQKAADEQTKQDLGIGPRRPAKKRTLRGAKRRT